MTDPNESNTIEEPTQGQEGEQQPSAADTQQQNQTPPEAQAQAAAEPEQVSAAEQIEQLQAAVQQAQENALRAQAEMQNVRKRSLREVEHARKFALERFMSDLLEVNDSLEKGLEAAEGDLVTAEQLKEGTELTLRILRQVFEKHGLELVDPTGEPFNPELHEAMSLLPSEDQPADSVLHVIQKGFVLNGRLLRPARVIVSREP